MAVQKSDACSTAISARMHQVLFTAVSEVTLLGYRVPHIVLLLWLSTTLNVGIYLLPYESPLATFMWNLVNNVLTKNVSAGILIIP